MARVSWHVGTADATGTMTTASRTLKKGSRALELATEAVRSAEQEVADVPIKNALGRKAGARRLTLSLKEVNAALLACRFAK